MPNFKEFIKGFEEKPEAKNPNPAPTPKPQEVKMEQPKQQPKPSKDPMPFGMKRRMEDEVSVHNGQQPKGGQQMPKKDYSYLDDRELYAQINLAENEEEYQDLLAEKERRWQESQKNKPEPKEGSFEKMMQGFEQPKTEEPKPQSKGGYFKPLSKEEKKTATEKGLTDDEYRYKQAQDWAILMNEPIPQKNEFMKGLEEKRKAQQPKQGSFEQAFGDNQPREEFSQEDKAALVATYGAFPEEGIVARKLPNGNYLTNILSGADTEPEEVDEATLSKVFDELRGEKGFEEIINEWRENPNLIRERRNVQ